MNNVKYFKLVDNEINSNDYFCCEKLTPIPTAEEIVNRFNKHPDCKNFPVIEITKEEFISGIVYVLNNIAENALDLKEWAPNVEKSLHLYDFWEK